MPFVGGSFPLFGQLVGAVHGVVTHNFHLLGVTSQKTKKRAFGNSRSINLDATKKAADRPRVMIPPVSSSSS